MKMNDWKYPLFWCISQEAREKLKKLHMEIYGTSLDIPPDIVEKQADIEPLEEIDKEMRKRPHHPRKVS